MMVMCSLVLLALKQLKACKNCSAYLFCNTVFSNYIILSCENTLTTKKIGADVLGHDVKPLKAKRIRFKTRRTLPKFVFVSADKTL